MKRSFHFGTREIKFSFVSISGLQSNSVKSTPRNVKNWLAEQNMMHVLKKYKLLVDKLWSTLSTCFLFVAALSVTTIYIILVRDATKCKIAQHLGFEFLAPMIQCYAVTLLRWLTNVGRWICLINPFRCTGELICLSHPLFGLSFSLRLAKRVDALLPSWQ